MKNIPLSIGNLNPRAVVEKITLKKISEQVPEAGPFMSKISFVHDQNGLHLNLQLLPPELANKIESIFG